MELGRRAANPRLGCGLQGSLRSLGFMNSLDLSPIPSAWPKLCQDLSVVLNCKAKKKRLRADGEMPGKPQEG